MKAIVKDRAAPGFSLLDVPEPCMCSSKVLIKVKKAAICGTDVHIHQWDSWAQKTIKPPLIIGHEFMGEVIEVGKEVKGFYPGMRVSGEGHLTCGLCYNCRTSLRDLCIHTQGVGIHAPGAFAETIALPAENVFPIPDTISDDLAAIFDPLGNAIRTALAFEIVGNNVLITGAGPIGLMATAIARKAGANQIIVTDLNDHRLEIAKDLGASTVFNPTKISHSDLICSIQELGDFTVGLEMSGSKKAVDLQVDSIYNGGKIALLGIPPDDVVIDFHKLIFKGLTLEGIYGRRIFKTWYQMTALLDSGLDQSIKKIITHHYSFDAFEKAFNTMQSGKSGKVIMSWD